MRQRSRNKADTIGILVTTGYEPMTSSHIAEYQHIISFDTKYSQYRKQIKLHSVGTLLGALINFRKGAWGCAAVGCTGQHSGAFPILQEIRRTAEPYLVHILLVQSYARQFWVAQCIKCITWCAAFRINVGLHSAFFPLFTFSSARALLEQVCTTQVNIS